MGAVDEGQTGISRSSQGRSCLCFAGADLLIKFLDQTEQVHKNPLIRGEWVFHVIVPDSRSFTLSCDNKEDFDRWTQTIGFITETVQRAR